MKASKLRHLYLQLNFISALSHHCRHTLESRHRELENQRLSKALEDAETNLNKLVASQIVLEDAAIKARQRLKASEAESTALGRKLETEARLQL